MYVIALDLTSPDEALNSLKKWLQLISGHLLSYYQSLGEVELAAQRKRHLHYLATARVQKPVDSVADEGDIDGIVNAAALVNFQLTRDHFFVPVVVVGCRTELLNVSDTVTMRSLRELQARLRFICLEVGAALLFSSQEWSRTSSVLRDYVVHRLFHEKIRMSLAIEV
jgi:hypothetical protein